MLETIESLTKKNWQETPTTFLLSEEKGLYVVFRNSEWQKAPTIYLWTYYRWIIYCFIIFYI